LVGYWNGEKGRRAHKEHLNRDLENLIRDALSDAQAEG
jgi:hypothetical protein